MTAGVSFDRDTAERLARMLKSFERSGGLNPNDLIGQRGNDLRADSADSKPVLGVIVAPDGEDDYNDARYWVATARITTDDNDPTSVPFAEARTGDVPRSRTVTAVNLAELAINSDGDGFNSTGHGLRIGSVVLMYRIPDSSRPRPIRRYVFASGGSAGGVGQYRITRVRRDYLEVVPWPLDPSRPGDEQIVLIAKPWLLRRRPFDGQTRNGISYNYTANTARTASRDGIEENQIIIPAYTESLDANDPDGDIIYATSAQALALDAADEDKGITLLDINADGRYWARVYEPPA